MKNLKKIITVCIFLFVQSLVFAQMANMQLIEGNYEEGFYYVEKNRYLENPKECYPPDQKLYIISFNTGAGPFRYYYFFDNEKQAILAWHVVRTGAGYRYGSTDESKFCYEIRKEYIYTFDSFAFDYCFTGEASNFKDIFSCRRFKGKYQDSRKAMSGDF